MLSLGWLLYGWWIRKEKSLFRKKRLKIEFRSPLIFQILLCRNWHLGLDNLVAEAS